MAAHFRICNDEVDSDDRMYRVPEALTRVFSKHYLAHLIVWGFLLICAKRVPDLSRQAAAFPHYFDRWKFARRNYAQALPRFVASKLRFPAARV